MLKTFLVRTKKNLLNIVSHRLSRVVDAFKHKSPHANAQALSLRTNILHINDLM